MEIRFIPRKYQETIFKSTANKNTLVVLPTGLGKTNCAIMLAIHRLKLFPNSKVLICAPTRPLCQQHVNSFVNLTDIPKDNIALYTGTIKKEKRKTLWQDSKVIVATPQTIKSDLQDGTISLHDVSLLCIDEAHRSKMRYASTYIASIYMQQSKNPRILALTASPGGTKEKINQICDNLFISDVEIRTYQDKDVLPYVQERKISWRKVELPESYKKIKNLLKIMLKELLSRLESYGIQKKNLSKKEILELQRRFHLELKAGKKAYFNAVSLIASVLKISHALELIETQGVEQLKSYLTRLEKETSKAVLTIKNFPSYAELKKLVQETSCEHPKMLELLELINQNKTSRIIVFANFRETVDRIYNFLKLNNIKVVKLIGQKKGLKQKEQISVIKDFASGKYNVLICTSIGEEGLDIAEANLAIFYEPVASEIRTIQRAGRVARSMPGRIIFLITKRTRDEAYYWSAKRKELTMKRTLKEFKNKNQSKDLHDFIK